MSFGESLQHLLSRVHTAMGVAIVGMDGIVVDERKTDSGLDLQALGAEYSTLLRSVDRTAANLEMNALHEFSVVYENRVLVIRRINDEYFLLLVLPSEREFGKGRFQLRRAVAGLVKEIA